MRKGFKKFVYLFITIFLTAVFSLILPFLSTYAPEKLNKLRITSGSADISDFQADAEKALYLSGEWEFYREKLLISDGTGDKCEPDLYISVPSSWTKYELDGKKIANGGCATYRLTVHNLFSEEPMVLSLPNLPGAYRAYIDGVLVSTNCAHAETLRSAESEVEIFTYPSVLSETPGGVHEITVEVSCKYSSGITVLPELSSCSAMQNRMIQSVSFRYLMIGIVVFFALTAAAYAVYMKGKSKQFWLVVLCVSYALRLVISNEGYLASHGLLFDINYEVVISLVYVSTYIIKLSMLMHIIQQLNLKVPQNVTVIFSALFLICAFVPYFLYEQIYYSTSFMWLQSVVFILDGYLIYKLCDAFVEKTKFSLIYLIGYCVNIAALVTDSYYLTGYIAGRVSFIMPLAVVGFIAVIIFVHINNTVKAHSEARKAAELGEELSELNTRLMISQIQPHFLYNALNSIKYMTKRDPKSAETAIVKFSNYLRANMDSLTQKEPIPVEKELEHVKNYAEIEKIRFGERLNIEFDIQSTDFCVPPLTVQPIVENAIKHGVNQKPEGGTVHIITRADENSRYIVVEDDGVGFDVNYIPDDGRSHVGIKNIKDRLNKLLGADVSIASVPGEGTRVEIRIPYINEEGRHNDENNDRG